MDTLANIADKNSSCGGTEANTGTLGCQIEFGTPLHTIGLKKGTVIPKDTVFDKTFIDAQIQLGNFIPLIGAESFESTSSEDTMSTNSRGVERFSVPGLPKWQLTFEEGNEFYKELARLTSFKALDFIFADGAGNWKIGVDKNGDFVGFSAGQALAMMTNVKVQGGDPESKTFTVQLIDREQWDINYAILVRSSLSFSPNDLDGINGVTAKVDPIADLDTDIVVTMKLAADNMTAISGLLTDDFLVMIDGVADAGITVVESGTDPGVYTITLSTAAAAGEVYSVSTFDATVNKYTVIVGEVLYRSNVATKTAA